MTADTTEAQGSPVTAEELAGVTVDMKVAARALSISLAYAYKLANNGEFPCRTIRVGSRWAIPTGGPDGLRELVGV